MDVNHIYQLRKALEPELALSVVGISARRNWPGWPTTCAAAVGCLRTRLSCMRSAGWRSSSTTSWPAVAPHLLLAFMCQFPNDLLRDSVVYPLESHAAVHAMGEANADFHNRWLEAFRAEDKAAIHHLMHEHMCDGAERVTVSEVRVGTEELLLPAGSNL